MYNGSTVSSADLDRIAADCALFATRRLARTVTRLYDRALEPAGVRGTQFNVLVAIDRWPMVGVSKLASVLGMDRTNFTVALRSLRRDGWVLDRTGSDRRVHNIVLSQAGKRLVAETYPRWRKVQDALEKSLGAGTWQELNKQLRRANRLISALGEDDAD